MGLLQEVEKSGNARGTLARRWTYLRRERWVLVGTTLLVIVTSAVDLLSSILMGSAIDQTSTRAICPAWPG